MGTKSLVVFGNIAIDRFYYSYRTRGVRVKMSFVVFFKTQQQQQAKLKFYIKLLLSDGMRGIQSAFHSRMVGE